LLGSAAALFIKALIMQQRLMNIKRDQWDARIFSQWMIGVQKPIAGAAERQVHVVRLAVEMGPEEDKPTAPDQEVPVAAPALLATSHWTATTWAGTSSPKPEE